MKQLSMILFACIASLVHADTAPPREQIAGVIGLSASDLLRLSLTHAEAEPLWVMVRFYRADGSLIRERMETVRSRRIQSNDLSGVEALNGSSETRMQVRVTFEVLGSPDGTLGANNEIPVFSLELVDRLTGKTIAMMQRQKR